jgi:hypothetical protein
VRDGYGKRFTGLLCSSLAAHAACIAALSPSLPQRKETRELATLWLETLPAPEPEPPPPAVVEPDPQPAASGSARRPTPRKPRAPQSQPAPAAIADVGPSLPLVAAEDSTPEGTVAVSDAVATAAGASEPQGPPAQLSLWLAPLELQRMVIVRSPSALLAALPGFRDILRGADIRPFEQLRTLRVFLPGFSAAKLTLAAEHVEGEAAIMQAAQRIAAAREQVPSWRRSSELQATAWLDGTSQDRGIAVHGSTFLIGPRRSLPGLLGEQAPGDQVDHLVKLRRGVVAAVTLYDVPRYLPLLQPCQLRNLRISVSAALRLHLQAEYDAAENAARSASCLTSLGEAADQLRTLRQLLKRATAAPDGSSRFELKTEVTDDEIARLLDELSWALRRARDAR